MAQSTHRTVVLESLSPLIAGNYLHNVIHQAVTSASISRIFGAGNPNDPHSAVFPNHEPNTFEAAFRPT